MFYTFPFFRSLWCDLPALWCLPPAWCTLFKCSSCLASWALISPESKASLRVVPLWYRTASLPEDFFFSFRLTLLDGKELRRRLVSSSPAEWKTLLFFRSMGSSVSLNKRRFSCRIPSSSSREWSIENKRTCSISKASNGGSLLFLKRHQDIK